MKYIAKLSDTQIKQLQPIGGGVKKLKKAILSACERALADKLPPIYESLAYGEGQIINLSIADETSPLVQHIHRLATDDQKNKGTVIRGLVAAYLARHGSNISATPTDSRFAAHISAQQWDYRPHQEQVYISIMDSLMRQRIGAVEAATGTGKTYAMLMAAIEILQAKPENRVVIGMPTLALVAAFNAAYRVMRSRDEHLPPAQCILGRREFVSKDRLQRAMKESYYDDKDGAVAQWIDEGAPPPAITHQDALPLPWTCDGLQSVAPTFPVDDVALDMSAEADDPGEMAYQSQFATQDVPLIFCTHAMLAVDVRFKTNALQRTEESEELVSIRDELKTLFARIKRLSTADPSRQSDIDRINTLLARQIALQSLAVADEGRLPRYHHLLVDEAHQLEGVFAGQLSQNVSIKQVQVNLKKYWDHLKRKSGVTGKEISRAKEITSLLSDHLGHDNNDVMISSSQQNIRSLLSEIAHLAGKVARPPADAELKVLQRYYQLKSWKREIEVASHTPYLRLTASPVKRFPRIVFGKPDVSYYLKHLWQAVEGGALLSATLYLPVHAAYSLAYQRECLALPSDRTEEYPPIIPEWVKGGVEAVHLPLLDPQKAGGDHLRPPLMRDKLNARQWAQAEQQWIEGVAQCLTTIDRQAKGGVLVLMTAYRAVNKLHDALKTHDALKKRLVVAKRNVSLESQRQRFFALTQQGLRPLWLAIGGAWTGVDVSRGAYADITGDTLSADDDWVLTDLVIPRYPLGTNRSLTHRYRMETNPGGQWEMHHAMFMLRQGMGRLIRNEALPGHRHIWLLDGRIADGNQKVLRGRVLRTLEGYRTIEEPCAETGKK